MQLVWWLHILLSGLKFIILVETFVSKSGQESSQFMQSSSHPVEDPSHFQSFSRVPQPRDLRGLRRGRSAYRQRHPSYLSHSSSRSEQPVAKHETFQEHIWINSPKPGARHFPTNHSGSLSRRVILHNRCSLGYLWVAGSRIFANGTKASPYVELQLQSVGQGSDRRPTFTIQGVAAKNFICFNKDGKIVAKNRGIHHLCRFQEGIASPMYTVFYAESNRTWYLSFDRRGKKVSVPSQTRRDSFKCRHFIAESHQVAGKQSTVEERSPDVPSYSGYAADDRRAGTRRQQRRSSMKRRRRQHQRRHNSTNLPQQHIRNVERKS